RRSAAGRASGSTGTRARSPAAPIHARMVARSATEARGAPTSLDQESDYATSQVPRTLVLSRRLRDAGVGPDHRKTPDHSFWIADHRHQGRHRPLAQAGTDLRDALHRLAL